MDKIELQAIAQVTMPDMAQTISELEPHEISDLFLQIAEKMNNPQDIKVCEERLMKCRTKRFGF